MKCEISRLQKSCHKDLLCEKLRFNYYFCWHFISISFCCNHLNHRICSKRGNWWQIVCILIRWRWSHPNRAQINFRIMQIFYFFFFCILLTYKYLATKEFIVPLFFYVFFFFCIFYMGIQTINKLFLFIRFIDIVRLRYFFPTLQFHFYRKLLLIFSMAINFLNLENDFKYFKDFWKINL